VFDDARNSRRPHTWLGNPEVHGVAVLLALALQERGGPTHCCEEALARAPSAVMVLGLVLAAVVVVRLQLAVMMS
jgi:hypothetical protein